MIFLPSILITISVGNALNIQNPLLSQQNNPVISKPKHDLFNILMQHSAATSCSSVIDNHQWNCGIKCNVNTKLLYAFHLPETESAGYIGYNSDLNALVISFRGSANVKNFFYDFQSIKTYPEWLNTDTNVVPENVQIHLGFQKIYRSFQDDFMVPFIEILKSVKYKQIIFTGHSLGGALSVLASIDIGLRHPILKPQLKVITFGQSRIGNQAYVDWMKTRLNLERVIAYGDVVPLLPPEWQGYRHGGVEYMIRDQETVKCVDRCENHFGFDFSIHAHGYYDWNFESSPC
ncbi:Alpha/Beta hydrolase protein [Globomyces pollinis-pini]|nr:Alpha/Beta hydrolase protein [Globomyces pollinis-pini]